ncbi:helix-turn-helix domain-containing protein [Arthrobacter sp. H16F315]|uniref:helix-turn-helix domain-containing protein n=1 Tax=Arthrobacter sp. H16F315 TaxID=2955314 RepID=UPI00209840CF|nr:helix-turn-helix domain-containing protein [Arthrobacter sp. H16F315]MDD1476495.1 helix-turn-helix domain-containing protein [Arthrobacter sp. H16F315]
MKEAAGDGRAVTLKDLANELGIHPSTVSRILHSGTDVARGPPPWRRPSGCVTWRGSAATPPTPRRLACGHGGPGLWA